MARNDFLKKVEAAQAAKQRQAAEGIRAEDARKAAMEMIRPGGTHEMIDAPIARIRRSPYQPRMLFDESALQDLANNIRQVGRLRQPIELRPIKGDPDHDYELLDGERRLQAHERILKAATIPAFVIACDDQSAAKLSALSFIGREGLRAIEQANAVKILLDTGAATSNYTAASLMGRAESYVRLLRKFHALPPAVFEAVGAYPDTVTATTIEDVVRLCEGADADAVAKLIRAEGEKGSAPSKVVAALTRKFSTASAAPRRAVPTVTPVVAAGVEIGRARAVGKKITIDLIEGIDPADVLELLKAALAARQASLEKKESDAIAPKE
ncbi:ParB/RepB/Spo0J family partition protein [Chitinimonas lacunae]|uniref:ParB/RepB/Spo0J family partition protein n=1 Tax=Chitinimonas lacunae TaxID=1963018 RepID=A0ABV8MUJ6_9NEIS